jgi:hypothetical protein
MHFMCRGQKLIDGNVQLVEYLYLTSIRFGGGGIGRLESAIKEVNVSNQYNPQE